MIFKLGTANDVHGRPVVDVTLFLQLYSLFLTRAAREVGGGGLQEWVRAGLTGLEAIIE